VGACGSKLLLAITDPSYLGSLSGLWGLLRAGGVFYGGLIGASSPPSSCCGGIAYLSSRLPTYWPRRSRSAISSGAWVLLAGCCYGAAAARRGASCSATARREISGTPLGVPLVPTQLYEAAFNLANYASSHGCSATPPPGERARAYLIGYGVARFVIEFFRGDATRFRAGRRALDEPGDRRGDVPLGFAILIWVRRRGQGQPVSE